MVLEALRGVRRLNEWLSDRLGRPYHAVLSIGLVTEIADRVRHLIEATDRGVGLVRTVLIILFCVALLINQLAELSHRLEHRRVR